MEQSGGGAKSSMRLIAVIGGAVVALLLVAVLRSRRETSRIDRAFKPIVGSIQESPLPDRAKEMLMDAVDEVRSALHSVKDMTDELATRS